MSIPKIPPKALLFFSIFSQSKDLINEILCHLSKEFGEFFWMTPYMSFDYTDYYCEEFGRDLIRVFVAMNDLVEQDSLVDIKIFTNKLEEKFSVNLKRLVNIDPGMISAERLVLATGKNFTHRIYLGKGIYADLTLIFQKKTFNPLPWTFPDYASDELISLFNSARNTYMRRIKQGE